MHIPCIGEGDYNDIKLFVLLKEIYTETTMCYVI